MTALASVQHCNGWRDWGTKSTDAEVRVIGNFRMVNTQGTIGKLTVPLSGFLARSCHQRHQASPYLGYRRGGGPELRPQCLIG